MKKRIEHFFIFVAELIYRRCWITMVMMSLFVGALCIPLPNLSMDSSSEGFLEEDDPILKAYNQFRDQYGRNEIIIIAIEPPDVFNDVFLKKLKKLHADLEHNVPHLEDVTSLINARNTRGDKDSLIVEELLKILPKDFAAMNNLKTRVLSNPQYLNAIIGDSGKFTTVVIKTSIYSSQGESVDDILLSGFDDHDPMAPNKADQPAYITNQEIAETLQAIRDIVAEYRADDFKIYMAGSPVIMDALKSSMFWDMSVFMRLAILVIGICLFLMFHRLSGVFLPLFVVTLTVLSTLGLMALAGIPIKMSSMILPAFLLAVGVGDSIHLLAIFYQELMKTGDKQSAIIHAMGHSGFAIVVTSLTTAAGLASFSAAEVAPVADLGIFSSIGVLLAMFFSILLLPALVAIIPIRAKKRSQRKRVTSTKLLDSIAVFAVNNNKRILATIAILVLFCLVGVFRLGFSHNLLSWLPEDLVARQDSEKIDKELRGSIVVEAIIDTGKANGLYEPAVLKKLDQLASEIKHNQHQDLVVARTSSLADMLKEIHQALNENNPKFYDIPDDPSLIAQELLLFENAGSDDLSDIVDPQFRKARLSVVVPWVDALKYLPFLDQLEARLQSKFGSMAEITVTGLMTLFARTISAAIYSAAESYIIAFIVITLMMIFLLGNTRDGFISMLPNLTPIIITLGIMGWVNLPLDMFTLFIGSIAIGLVVDDTVHFMYNFRRYHTQCGDVLESVRRTLNTSGRAMLATTVALSSGFLVFIFGSMNNVVYFGFLTGITILLALVTDFFMVPALMS